MKKIMASLFLILSCHVARAENAIGAAYTFVKLADNSDTNVSPISPSGESGNGYSIFWIGNINKEGVGFGVSSGNYSVEKRVNTNSGPLIVDWDVSSTNIYVSYRFALGQPTTQGGASMALRFGGSLVNAEYDASFNGQRDSDDDSSGGIYLGGDILIPLGNSPVVAVAYVEHVIAKTDILGSNNEFEVGATRVGVGLSFKL